MAATNTDFFNPYFDPSIWQGQTPSLYEALVSAVEQWALPALPRNLIRRGWVPRAALPAGTRDYAIVCILNRAPKARTRRTTPPLQTPQSLSEPSPKGRSAWQPAKWTSTPRARLASCGQTRL